MQEYFFPREDDAAKKGKGDRRWARGRRFRGRAATPALPGPPEAGPADAAAGASRAQLLCSTMDSSDLTHRVQTCWTVNGTADSALAFTPVFVNAKDDLGTTLGA
jgi:hypothetical protein